MRGDIHCIAKRAKAGIPMKNQITFIIADAMRIEGKLLAAQDMNVGDQGKIQEHLAGTSQPKGPVNTLPPLVEMGISYQESSGTQAIAEIGEQGLQE